jgi:hypothetical protein
MATFKDRLIEERNQLFEKVTKLEDFLQSETFKSIDVRQASLLEIQLPTMKAYLQILTLRLSLL